MGITRSTLNEWKKKFSDISDTLKKGKEVIDRQVENALLKRALGYKYEEVIRELGVNPATGDEELIVTKVVTKEVQPDTTAQIFWLKNRKPDVWRDTPLQQLQAEKLKAETDFAQMRAAKLKGNKKDTSMLETLLEGKKNLRKWRNKEHSNNLRRVIVHEANCIIT